MTRDSRTGWKRIAAPLAVVLFFASLPAGAEPEFLVTSGKVLDSHWEAYFASGDTQAIRAILDYEDCEDLLLRRINEHFDALADQRILGVLSRLRVARGETAFSTEFDLDTLTGILFRSPEFRDDLRALFDHLPDAEALMVRAAVKSAAFWSLLANARQHEEVKRYVEGQIPGLKPSSRFLFGFFQGPPTSPIETK